MNIHITDSLKKKILATEEKNWRGIHPDSEIRMDPELKLNSRLKEFEGIIDRLDPKMRFAGKRTLNVGCGFGYFELVCRERGFAFIGIDPDHEEISIARQLQDEDSSGAFIRAIGEELPLKDASVDRIVTFSVLEHVQSIPKVLKECFRVLRPDGKIYIGVPNFLRFREGHYKVSFFPCMWRPLAKIYLKLRGKKPGFLDSLNYVTPNSIRRDLIGAGFEVISDPFEEYSSKLEEIAKNPNDFNGKKRLATFFLFRQIIKFLIKNGFLISNSFIGQKSGV